MSCRYPSSAISAICFITTASRDLPASRSNRTTGQIGALLTISSRISSLHGYAPSIKIVAGGSATGLEAV